MIINRTIFNSIKEKLQREPRVLLLFGPRQAGKTTLIKEILKNYIGHYVFFNGDDIRTQEVLSFNNLESLKKLVGVANLVIIDEAQRIENIGLTLKLLYDSLGIYIIASGSSSFDLANKTAEPLTGRTVTYTLYPFSLLEIPIYPPEVSLISRIEEFLRFGLYPKVITTEGETEKQEYLNELLNTYLYKDILAFGNIRKPKKIIDLLSLLALQIGSEVSTAELAQNLSLSKIIVEKYLDLLEKMFIIINVCGFSRNLRKEISKTSKYYFVDLGLRNVLIRNFNKLNIRNDAGPLFENLCIIERMKALGNQKKAANFYFWRTYDQKEIDLIEEREGRLFAFEFKWSEKSVSKKAPSQFLTTYLNSTYQTITPNLLEEFLKK